MTYTFNEGKHIHELDGKPLMGVTTVLGTLSKPALIGWAANMAVDYVDKARHSEKFKLEDLPDILKEARTAWRTKRDKAGEAGTSVHDLIETWINNSIAGNIETEHENPQVQEFINWAIQENVEFIEAEKHMYSEKYWIGGICDFICKIDGDLYVGDIKTGKAIYEDFWFQTSAYSLMLEGWKETTQSKLQKLMTKWGLAGAPKEVGVYGNIIVNVPKAGGMNVKRLRGEQIRQNIQTFIHILEVYKVRSKLKKL